MEKPLRVLMVEDSENDALLVLRQLKKGGYEPDYERVETAEAMRKALSVQTWDVILCDYQLPQFNGAAAIALLKETGIDIPLIIVTGAIGEETAADCMRYGARDYIMKNNLSRLVPAIEREREEAKSRMQRRQAEDELHETERKFFEIFQNAPVAMAIGTVDDGRLLYVNEQYLHITEMSREALIGHTVEEFNLWADPRDRKKIINVILQNHGRISGYPVSMRVKSGRIKEVLFSADIISISNIPCLLSSAVDISERKRAEEELNRQIILMETLIDTIPSPIFFKDREGRYLGCNAAFEFFVGRSKGDIVGKTVYDISPTDLAEIYHKADLALMGKPGIQQYESTVRYADGSRHDVIFGKAAFLDHAGKVGGLVGVMTDITERKLAEEDRRLSMERLRKALGGTVQAISMAVETKDPYTAGHQRRTADLARAIAVEMGLSADRTDFIRIASTIHDIGKIAVPAEILSKPTKLSEIEFSLIRTHAQAGYDILKDIEFPWPVADVILQHHERMDGSGYPNSLKSDDILPEARILMVADVMESMASHRPYRPSLGVEAALAEISKNRTVLYDADVVDACLKLFREEGYAFV
jgi:PAS domain S-box-containing protein